MTGFRKIAARSALAGLLTLGIIAPLMATPASDVRTRIAGYRALGASFKSVNDGLRAGNLSNDQALRLARQISASARAQYRWYPAGSGPSSGARTAAKAEIWSRPRAFRTAQDAFARQAAAFQRVAATGDTAALRTAARQLGASCKACHDVYRNEDD